MRPAVLAFAVFAASLPLFSAACSSDTVSEPPVVDSGVVVDSGAAVDAAVDSAPACETPAAPPGTAGPVTLGTCPTVSACGGTLEGTTWTYTAACTDDPTAQLTSRCPAAVITKVDSKITGTLQFFCGKAVRAATTKTHFDVTFPLSCVPLPVKCSQLGALISSQIPGATGTCVDSQTANACDCAVDITGDLSDSGAYKIVGNKVQTATETYDFCVKDGTLTHGVDPNAQVKGTFTATKN
jgi:hypothetical protein